MPITYTCSKFLHDLLKGCIGTIMIEWDQWDFPSPGFDRGYFNNRLKKSNPINRLSHDRLNRLFECVFTPEMRKGRFQETQAVEAANSLIKLIQDYFQVDLSIWENNYTSDNKPQRSYLLDCLDRILSLSENKNFLPVTDISESLSTYLADVKSNARDPRPTYPEPLVSVLYPQTEYFIERQEITTSIVQKLIDGESCYLYGEGGIGKTEIAKSVLKVLLNTPSSISGITHILWVNCNGESLTLSLVHSLHLDQKINNVEQAFQAAIKKISTYRNHLLIVIDNINILDHTTESIISEYLHCRVLITSRCKGFSSLTEFSIPFLSEDDCIKLFYAYYHGDKDNITLRKIINLCDCLPLAVELLSKIADAEELLLYEFYETLVKCGFNLSSEEVASAHEKLHSEGTVIQQLSKVFQVYDQCLEEQTLLVQISTIPNIRFDFYQAQKWFLQKNRTLLNHLENKGWIKKETLYDNGRNHYCYYIHSVIASAIRFQFIDKLYILCQNFIHEITVEMKSSLLQNDATKKELIQFSWSLNDIFQGRFQSEDDSDFLWTLAEIYRDIGYYERALPLLDSLDTLYCKLYGKNNIHLASIWNSRGIIHYQLSNFQASLHDYKISYNIYKKNLQEDSCLPSDKMNLAKLNLNLGMIYMRIDYTKSIKYFNRADKILSENIGTDKYLKLNITAHKAMFLSQTGQLEKAQVILKDIYRQSFSNSSDREMLLLHADVAHHIGIIYSNMAPQKAMPYLEEAKDIFWNLLSPSNPDTLDVLNSICSLRLTIDDDYDDIQSNLQKLLELFINTYGPNDPNTGTIYNNIGLCYYYMQKPDKALDNYKQALQIDFLYYGEDHESSAYILNNIGNIYSETGRPELAIPEHEHALRIYETVYPNHLNLDLAQTHSELAGVFLQTNNTNKVNEHLDKAFYIYGKMLPENAGQLLMPYCTQAELFYSLGKYDEAITSYSHILWLLKENGYSKDSNAFHEFADRIDEIKQLKSRDT